MKYCDKCKVSVRGNHARCPLCQHTVSGKDDPASYPKTAATFRQYVLWLKIIIFASASIGIISVAINLILPKSGKWSFFVVLGIACFWLSLALAVKKKNNIPKNIMYQTFVVSTLSVLWDFVTDWRGWSIDFVVPVSSVIAMISLFTAGKIMKLHVSDYIVCVIINVVLGTLPIVLYFCGALNVVIPSIICAAFGLVSMSAVLIFFGGEIKRELARKFHI